MKRNSSKKGFTLIELIVVIAILGILAAIAIPRFSGFQANANAKAAKATLNTIETAIQSVASNNGCTPTVVATTEAYVTEVENLLGWAITDIAGGRVITTDPTTPKNAVYSISATGVPTVVIKTGTAWPSDIVGSAAAADVTVTWNDIKSK